MKIMFVTNNPEYKYDRDDMVGWNLLPSLFKKHNSDVLGIGKYEIHKIYFKYLKFKPDIIIVEWVPGSNITILLKKLGLIKCPILFNWGDYYAEMMTNYPKTIVKFLENHVLKNVDYVIAISKLNEVRARKIGKKVSYIPHGYFDSNKKSNINLDKLKTKKNNLKIIYLGEQSKWKQVDQIISAVKGVNCDLFLFGVPNPEFLKFAGKNVHFMGVIDASEVMSVLKKADILVNTSNQDCSYKFFEYISVGKPILAYDGLPANILTHLKTAYLTKDFRKGLIELINSKKLRDSLGRNVKRIKTYSWDEIAEKYLEVFKKVILENKNK